MCIGCFRTLEEIANWRNYSDSQKHEVNKLAAERMNGLFDS